jgi:hypothetical protein
MLLQTAFGTSTLALPQLRQSPTAMTRVDRLGWTAGTCFASYGLRIGVRVNRADVLERLPPHLPPGWKATLSPVVDHLCSLWVESPDRPASAVRGHLLYAGSTRLAQRTDLAELLGLLESHLQLYVAERARRRVFVHAGVVGWQGRGILLPGRSYSGKTTLVAALLRAGATYYSDEYAVLDARGRVHPYPRLLSMRDEGTLRPIRCAPAELGAAAGSRPLPVGLVAVIRYRPGARWHARPMSPRQAALALLANTVSARRQPAAVLTALTQVISHATSLKGVRGEAESMVDTLLNSALIYDVQRDWGHSLNETAAFVWRHCDGKTTVRQIADVLQQEVNLPQDERVIWFALAQLGRAHLLQQPVTPPTEAAGVTRRELIRKLGLAGALVLLVPVVDSIVAPTPARAASGGGSGDPPKKPKGNNGVGNGVDPQPPGNPPINDGPGTGPGNPGNKGGGNGNGNGNGNGKGKGKG